MIVFYIQPKLWKRSWVEVSLRIYYKYKLYHNQSEYKIEITRGTKNLHYKEIIDGVFYYNDCYYLSNSKKLLKEKANEILMNWIEKQEKELLLLKNIKIKTV
jgi:hypothetical protein